MTELADQAVSLVMYIIRGTDMGYTSFVFMACLAGFLVVYWLLRPQCLKRVWILIAGLVFYVWAGDRGSLIIICATALIVYLAGRRMEQIYSGYETETAGMAAKERMQILDGYKKRTRRYLWLAIILILAVWIYVKTGRFFEIDTVGKFSDFSLFRNVIVSLGISYYSLSSIGYLLDIYWQKTKPEHNFLTLFTVMTYFPHIVQGPISRYQKLTKQMNDLPKFDFKRVCFGLQLMLWGYVKKMVIADRLALFTGTIFAAPSDYAGVEVLLAVVFSVFQLYADFSGCMDIVCGISQAIGIELDVNFRQPFFSRSAAEFWRRWHITLGSWMKDYIYFPISTNPRFIKWTYGMKKNGRKKLSSFLKTLIPSLAVWILTGLWHGTGIDYVVWGLYWCALIVIGSECRPAAEKVTSVLKINPNGKGYHIWQSVRTFIFFGVGRMFTVAGGLRGFAEMVRQMFHVRLWVLFDGSLFECGLDLQDFAVAVIGIIMILLVDMWHEHGVKIRETIAAIPLPLRWAVYYTAIFAIFILGVYGSGYDAASFIYGAF